MLRKWLLLRSTDANTEVASSNTSDANNQDSSPEQQDANNAEGDEVDNAVAEFAQDNNGDEDTSQEATGEEIADDQQNGQQQQQAEPEAENVVLDKPEDKDLQFHKHPRFQEVIAQKNAAQKQYEDVKPLVEQQRAVDNIMRQYNISPQEFQSWIQYGIDLRTNPARALAAIEPIYQRLAQLEGKVLPQDLEAEVAAGTLARERAVEIAKGRAQSQYGQIQQQWNQNGQQHNSVSIVQGTIGQWAQTKMRIDADLKEGSALWKQVDLQLRAMPLATDANDAWQKCEQAYKEAKEFFKGLQPRVVTKQNRAPMQSRQAVQNNGTTTPKTMEEAIKGFISSSRRPNALR